MTKITLNSQTYYSTYEPEDVIEQISKAIRSDVIKAEVKTATGHQVTLEKSGYVDAPKFRMRLLR